MTGIQRKTGADGDEGLSHSMVLHCMSYIIRMFWLLCMQHRFSLAVSAYSIELLQVVTICYYGFIYFEEIASSTQYSDPITYHYPVASGNNVFLRFHEELKSMGAN